MSGLDTGLLDTRVRFERKVAPSTTGLNKPGAETWEPIATVWAQVQDVLPSRAERAAEGVDIAARPARIRLRYRTDITSDMRIVVGDRIMQIIAGPAVRGRRDGIEVMAQESKPG